MGWAKRVIQPLRSRKVRVALATVFAAYGASFGFGVSEEVVLTMLSVGVAVILGIAIEDSGEKSARGSRPQITRMTQIGKNGDGNGREKPITEAPDQES